jgi:ATP-dependent Lon protease
MTDSDSNPPGFQSYVLSRDDYRRPIELLVPTYLKDVLIEDVKRRLKEEEDAREAALKAAQVLALDLPRTSAKTPASLPAAEKTKDDVEQDQERERWQQIDAVDKGLRSRSNYPVFKSAQALALFKSHSVQGDSDSKHRLEKIYKDIQQRGTTLREIAKPKSLRPLQELAAKQPHMKEVVQFVIAQLNMAQRSQKPVRLQPMLLVGEAGVGKTHFAQALATALSTTLHIQQLDSDLTSSFLLGSDSKWSNTSNGVLFDKLVLGQHANPIFVLDELDKSPRALSYGSPVTSLYSVLEPLSAKSVRDISLLFEFDASLVTWIATANHALLLDQPLRSRFREFHIMPPTAEECLVLAAEVMKAAIQSVAVKGFKPDVSLRRHLAHLPARQIWQFTLEGIANALAANRKQLQQQDFPRWLFDDTATNETSAPPKYFH